MKYQVKTFKKVGVSGYEDIMNSTIETMAAEGWKVQEMSGSPDQGFLILFSKEQ